MSSGQANAAIAEDKAHTLNATHETQTIATPYTASSFAQYAEGVGTVRASGGDLGGGSETLLTEPVPFRKSKRACSTTDNETWVPADASNTLNNFDLGDTRTTHAVVQPIPIQDGREMEKKQNGLGIAKQGDPAYTIDTTGAQSVCHTMPGSVAPTIGASGPPYSRTGNERVDAEALAVTTSSPLHFDTYNQTTSDVSFTLSCSASDANHTGTVFVPNMAVRRLTPVECERLQGFPDNWSRISWKGKPEEECPDGPRYKACGNSMAVPVMRWIGERIAAVDSTLPSNA
jgi:DNA (cytosine-5)-methyltransferase 1